uniref:Ig-like domain-containing protein n=1 Tax=Anas zonorhyncha TaxID=75864 RepID=A0A8B9VTQ3_9AVES
TQNEPTRALHQLPSPSPLLVFSGLQAQTREELSQREGSNLSVLCPYTAEHEYRERKSWCRWIDQQYFPNILSISKAQKGRASIQDDTQKRSITITMEKLQAQDSGMYWCALYRPYTSIPFTRIMEVRLSVAKREYLLADFKPDPLSISVSVCTSFCLLLHRAVQHLPATCRSLPGSFSACTSSTSATSWAGFMEQGSSAAPCFSLPPFHPSAARLLPGAPEDTGRSLGTSSVLSVTARPELHSW